MVTTLWQLYEASVIDGAGKWRQTLHITSPSITFVIVIVLIFRVGGLLNAGFEQILLLYRRRCTRWRTSSTPTCTAPGSSA